VALNPGGERLLLHTPTPDYGVIEWDPVTGTHDFSVRVTDQSGATTEFSWQVVTDDDAFVFVDATAGDDTAAGDIDHPLATFAGLWNRSFAGRIAVFREGTYEVFATADAPSPILDRTRTPNALVGFPGESVTFDMSRGHFRTSIPRFGASDFLATGIDFVGSRADLRNNRLFNITRRQSRMTFWDCSFDSNTAGTDPRDNPGAITFMSDGGYHENIAVIGCRLGSGAKTQLIVTFDSNHVLLEGNRAVGVNMPANNGSNFLNAKDDTNNLTVRNNFFQGGASSAITNYNQITLDSAANQELCWNTAIFDGMGVSAAISINGSSNTPAATNTYVYRNTVISQQDAFRFLGGMPPSPPLFEGNAYFSAGRGVFGSDKVTTSAIANVELAETDFGTRGEFVGSARAMHGGLAGAEVLALP